MPHQREVISRLMKPKSVTYTTNASEDNGNMSWSASTGDEYLRWIADVLMQKKASDSMVNEVCRSFGIEANMFVEGSPLTKKTQNQKEVDKISCNDYLSAIGCAQNNGRT